MVSLWYLLKPDNRLLVTSVLTEAWRVADWSPIRFRAVHICFTDRWFHVVKAIAFLRTRQIRPRIRVHVGKSGPAAAMRASSSGSASCFLLFVLVLQQEERRERRGSLLSLAQSSLTIACCPSSCAPESDSCHTTTGQCRHPIFVREYGRKPVFSTDVWNPLQCFTLKGYCRIGG